MFEYKDEEVGKKWDKYSFPRYLNPKRVMYDQPFYTSQEKECKKVFDSILNELDKKEIDSAIEIGCGNGRNIYYMVQSGIVKNGIGIDVSKGAIEGAIRNYEYFGVSRENLKFCNVSFNDFDTNIKYTLVLCPHIINYVEDLEFFFSRIKDLVIPGGYLFICDVQKPYYSVVTKIKKSKTIMSFLNKKPYDDYLVFHKWGQVLEKAIGQGFVLKKVNFAFFSPLVYIDKISYKLCEIEFNSELLRMISKLVYNFVSKIICYSNNIFTKFPNGQVYYSIFYYSGKGVK